MNYTENYLGIKLDIQAQDGFIEEGVQQSIRDVIDKLLKYTPKINFCDVYLTLNQDPGNLNKNVKIRLGIPGPDVFAEDKGEYWQPTLRSAGDKLARQLQKKES
jgi:putative sigma-54 modulation protein